jgi:peptidoglycan-associated lipoprotein
MYYSAFGVGAVVSALILVGCASVEEVPSMSSNTVVTPAEAAWQTSTLESNVQNPIATQQNAVVDTTKQAPVVSSEPEQTAGLSKSEQVTPPTAATPKPEASKQTLSPLDDPKSLLAQRTIYFDFDSCYIKPNYEKMLNAHARYLKSHHADHLLIEGHTDERGSPEYNKQLGERRAENVRHALRYRGVSDQQLKALSIGEAQPKNKAHDAKAFAENRRAELVYHPQ